MAGPRLDEGQGFRGGLEVRDGVFHEGQAEEQEAESDYYFAYVLDFALLAP